MEIGAGKKKDKSHKVPKVTLSKRDIAHIKAELFKGKLLDDIADKGLEKNHTKYVQKYLLPKLDDEVKLAPGKEEKEEPFIIKHNLRSNDLAGFVKEFEKNEKGRIHKRKDQPTIHHTIISWHILDSPGISDAMLKDMAHKYIELRGKDNIFCGTAHKDRDHLHLHLGMSATNIFGMSSSIRKADFENVKDKLQAYMIEKYPNLIHSITNQGQEKSKEFIKEELKNIKCDERFSVKNELSDGIRSALSKAQTTEQFISLLHESGYKEYYRSGQLTGVQLGSGLKFRFSRLGFSLDDLAKKDLVHQKEQKQLEELRAIRQKKERTIRDIKQVEEEKTELEDLATKVLAPEKEEIANLQDWQDQELVEDEPGKEQDIDKDEAARQKEIDEETEKEQAEKDQTEKQKETDVENEKEQAAKDEAEKQKVIEEENYKRLLQDRERDDER